MQTKKRDKPFKTFQRRYNRVQDNPEEAKPYAAAAQRFLEDIVIANLESARGDWNGSNKTLGPAVDGILLTGGIALNMLLSRALRLHFKMPVRVPPVPSDGGLVLGALYLRIPSLKPLEMGERLRIGMFLDRAKGPVSRAVIRYNAVTATPASVAGLLTRNKSVIVLRGRQAIGGLAMAGSRCVLASPHHRVFLKKFQDQWYVPMPMVVAESPKTRIFVDRKGRSPDALTPLEVQSKYRTMFPNATDGCGIARAQTVPVHHSFIPFATPSSWSPLC